MGKKTTTDDGLTKDERKALRRQEAQLLAELNARAAEPKKSKKAPTSEPGDMTELKGKALRSLVADKTNGKELRKRAQAELDRRAVPPETPAREADELAEKRSAKRKTLDAAEKVLSTPSTDSAKEAAETAHEAATEATDDETDEQIRARVHAKRQARAAAAVKSESTGKPVASDVPGSAHGDDAQGDESEVEYQTRKRREQDAEDEAKPARKGKAPKPAIEQRAEEVETERGRVFTVGESVPESSDEREFAIPSETDRADYATNGNGQYLVQRPSDGKLVGYTRVTTYIDTNEDKSLLTEWKMRILLEGVAINDSEGSGREERRDPVSATVADLVHRRDVAIKKARKADRKGELTKGQLAVVVDGAWSSFRKALNTLADELLDVGGAHEKAAKGTQIHELLELHDREGVDAVGSLLEAGAITPADLADVEAYARALDRAGVKIIPELIETPVVIDDLGVAGRLDRVVLCKLPGAQRATRHVLDVKSGRLDLGGGKIAQQLELYSRGETYDLDTHERGKHGASRTKALVLHLVPGSAEATLHVVDLGLGRVGNELSGKVRAYRNDGKRAIDLKTDLAAVTPA